MNATEQVDNIRRPPATVYPPEVQKLFKLSDPESDDAWLNGAESSVTFLRENVLAERIVIYASLPHGVLALLKRLQTPDRKDLQDFLSPDAGWRIQHVSGGGKPDRVYLAGTLEGATLSQGERVIFRRSWQGADRTAVEISQKLVHALDLYYVAERNAYCCLDEHGDINEIIKIFDLPSDQFGKSICVVTIRSSEFYKYARLCSMGLVFFYDFARCPAGFGGWFNQQTFQHDEPYLFYHGGHESGGASYINGAQIVIPPIAMREILRHYKDSSNVKKRRYAKFLAVDLRQNKTVEASCSPHKLSSYFDKGSKLPLEMCPAFFRPEVLYKYKADSSKYILTDRQIYCRGAWGLETYDVNEAGQVHTYLRYLANLPYQEQLYWRSFNVAPNGFVSKRALRSDYLGEWDTEYDPLNAVKRKVTTLDEGAIAWWNPRGEHLARTVHRPRTASEAEWAEAILALDRLVVEGLLERPLREIAIKLGRKTEDEWRALKLMQECLVGAGAMQGEAQAAVDPLRKVHGLRSTVKGHAALARKAQEVKAAITAYGSLGAHFEALAAECDDGLAFIMEKMKVGGVTE